jgi:hypothetical protein
MTDTTEADVKTGEMDFGGHAPAKLVHERYPHTGVRHALTPGSEPGSGEWYEHLLPNGRIAVCAWLYDSSTDRRSRTIVVREWNNPKSKVVHSTGGVHLGAQCSYLTIQFLDELAKLAPVTASE